MTMIDDPKSSSLPARAWRAVLVLVNYIEFVQCGKTVTYNGEKRKQELLF